MKTSVQFSTESMPVSQALINEIDLYCSHHRLTPRESEVVAILAEGLVKIKDVALRLGLSPNTVNNHVNSIFMKTKTKSKSELLAGLLNYVSNELQQARYFKQSPRVLLLEQDKNQQKLLSEKLESVGCRVAAVETQSQLESVLQRPMPHFVVANLDAIKGSTSQFLHLVVRLTCAQVILLGDRNQLRDKWRVMHDGAIELLPNPVDIQHLVEVLFSHFIEDDTEKSRFLSSLRRGISAANTKVATDDVKLTRDNLGAGGMFLSLEDLTKVLSGPVNVGDQLELKLRFEKLNETFVAKGQVVWCRSPGEETFGKPGVGVRFTQLTRWQRDHLTDFLRENKILSYIPAGLSHSLASQQPPM